MNKQLAQKFKALETKRSNIVHELMSTNEEIRALAQEDDLYFQHYNNSDRPMTYSRFYEIVNFLKSINDGSDASEDVIEIVCDRLKVYSYEVLDV